MTLIMPGYYQRDPDFYVTDFSEYTTGAAPPDWTAQEVTAGSGIVAASTGSISGKAFQFTNLNSGSGRITYSWNRVPQKADVEILCRARQMTPGDTKPITGQFGRGTSLNLGTLSYLRNEVRYRTASSNDTLGINVRTVAGTGTFLAQVDGQAPLYSGSSPTPWLWSRLRLQGSNFQCRWWIDGQAEPGTWTCSDVDSSLLTAGLVGIMFTASTSVPVIQTDFYSVALNGKTAPSVKR